MNELPKARIASVTLRVRTRGDHETVRIDGLKSHVIDALQGMNTFSNTEVQNLKIDRIRLELGKFDLENGPEFRERVLQGVRLARLSDILCSDAFDYAIGKRSSNMIASWLFTACHSRTERFHS